MKIRVDIQADHHLLFISEVLLIEGELPPLTELLPVVKIEVPPVVEVELLPVVEVEVPPVESIAEAHVREHAVVGRKQRVRLKKNKSRWETYRGHSFES